MFEKVSIHQFESQFDEHFCAQKHFISFDFFKYRFSASTHQLQPTNLTILGADSIRAIPIRIHRFLTGQSHHAVYQR